MSGLEQNGMVIKSGKGTGGVEFQLGGGLLWLKGNKNILKISFIKLYIKKKPN